MILLGWVILLLLGGNLSRSAIVAKILSFETLSQVEGKPIRIEMTTGEQWMHVMKLFKLKIKAPPQVVIWSEDREGRFLDTLFITRKVGKQFWGKQSKQDPDKVFHEEALPYWMYKRYAQGLPFPTKDNPLPDAITGASPKKDFIVQTKVQTDLKEIYVLLEANISFDVNQTYFTNAPQGMEVYNKTSGQPAVVYRAEVDLGTPGEYEMKLIGHSSPAGEDGELYEDLQGLTTALQIIKKVVVVVE